MHAICLFSSAALRDGSKILGKGSLPPHGKTEEKRKKERTKADKPPKSARMTPLLVISKFILNILKLGRRVQQELLWGQGSNKESEYFTTLKLDRV